MRICIRKPRQQSPAANDCLEATGLVAVARALGLDILCICSSGRRVDRVAAVSALSAAHAQVSKWHGAKFRAEPASAEVECIGDIAGDWFLARNFCGRGSRRDRCTIGHANNVARSRE